MPGPSTEAEPKLGSREQPYSVTRVVKGVNRTLERVVGSIWMEGEVSSLRRPSSGHVYFCLKDGSSQLAAVIWRSEAARLRFAIEEGMTLRCRVRLGLYERDGRFQVYVQAAEPGGGLGADAAALEALKRRLADEGLFDVARRPLPLLPRRIGVVTSKSGAAIRDIVRAVQRRFPVPILVADARVQGPSAPRQIVHALGEIYRAPIDVVILGRGGGSANDLSAFNDERVVRKVARCPVPLISAVGHEIDVTLSDLAADHRAATPTMAGEMAVPVLAELSDALEKEERRLGREIAHRLRSGRQDLDVYGERLESRARSAIERRRRTLGELGRALAGRHPRAQLSESRRVLEGLERHLVASIDLDAVRRTLGDLERRLHTSFDLAERRRTVAELERRLGSSLEVGLARRRYALESAVSQLGALSPLAVLERGYALARAGDRVLRDAAGVAAGDPITVRLRRGRLDCRVEAVWPESAATSQTAEAIDEQDR